MQILTRTIDQNAKAFVFTVAESRHPILIPDAPHIRPWEIEEMIEQEVERRLAARMFLPGRHDGWKAARRLWTGQTDGL